MFLPTRKVDATSWSWWVNWFSWVRIISRTLRQLKASIHELPSLPEHKSAIIVMSQFETAVQWGGVGFCMSGFWEYWYGEIPLLEYRIQVRLGRGNMCSLQPHR